MERPASDGKRLSRHPPRWSGRALKTEGIVFVLVGVASAIVMVLLSVSHTIALTTRDTELRGSVAFALVGVVTFFIGWRKSRRTGS